MCQLSGTVLHARQNSIKKQTEINLNGHVLNWRELKSLGPCRISLGISFINTVHLSIWAIHKVQLSTWNAINRRFYHFTLEPKIYTGPVTVEIIIIMLNGPQRASIVKHRTNGLFIVTTIQWSSFAVHLCIKRHWYHSTVCYARVLDNYRSFPLITMGDKRLFSWLSKQI